MPWERIGRRNKVAVARGGVKKGYDGTLRLTTWLDISLVVLSERFHNKLLVYNKLAHSKLDDESESASTTFSFPYLLRKQALTCNEWNEIFETYFRGRGGLAWEDARKTVILLTCKRVERQRIYWALSRAAWEATMGSRNAAPSSPDALSGQAKQITPAVRGCCAIAVARFCRIFTPAMYFILMRGVTTR